MSWLERLWERINPCRTEWRLFHKHATMECRIVEASRGVEIQFIYRGELYYRFVYATRAAAEDEAKRKRADLIQRGWLDHVWQPDAAHTS
jgi:hypothetical protein